MIRGLVSFLLVLAWFFGYSQHSFKVYGEHNGDHLTLAWIPESWTPAMTGVIIKRKEDNGPWLPVSDKAYIPASYVGKNLSNVDQLVSEQERLDKKLSVLINEGKAKPVSHDEFKERLVTSPNPGASIAMIFAMDYDLIRLNGFGLIDRDVKPESTYTYGVFSVINGATAAEPAGEITISFEGPDEITMKSGFEVIGKNKKLRLQWEFDLKTYRASNFKGFDIFAIINSQRVKLNNNLIWITSKEEPGILTYLTDFPAEQTAYAAVPVSYFNRSGKEQSFSFDPNYYTAVILAPVLEGRVNDDLIELSWSIDHKYDTLIDKVIISSWQGNGFEAIAELKSSDRKYEVTSKVEGLSRYRLSLHTKAGRIINSNDKVISLKKNSFVESPSNLTGEVITDTTGNFIQLSWSYPADQGERSFRIFTEGPDGNLIYNSALSRNVNSPMNIPVRSFAGKKVRYAVQAMDSQRNKSTLSDSIEVITPSKRLPQPRILKVQMVDGQSILDWSFSDQYMDLKGFRVYINDEEVGNENEITITERQIVLPSIEPGIHTVAIQAISIYGLESDVSNPFKYRVE